MTREEAKKLGVGNIIRISDSGQPIMSSYEVIVDKIYDDLESRVCENCRYLEYIGKSYKSCEMLGINIGCDAQQDFYCQLFERK